MLTNAQRRAISWQNTMGGAGLDRGTLISKLNDQLYICAGSLQLIDTATGEGRNQLDLHGFEPGGNERWNLQLDLGFILGVSSPEIYITSLYTEANGQGYVHFTATPGGDNIIYFDSSGNFLGTMSAAYVSSHHADRHRRIWAQPMYHFDNDDFDSLYVGWNEPLGPDTGIIIISPTPESNVWTVKMQQHLHSPVTDIKHHFVPQDWATNSKGNYLLLCLLNTWQVQHCVDCNDVFIANDYMLYEWDSSGNLLHEIRLGTGAAQMAKMQFAGEENSKYYIHVTDLNVDSADMESKIFVVDTEFHLLHTAGLGRWYESASIQQGKIGALGHDFRPSLPGTHGSTEFIFGEFDSIGHQNYFYTYGGSGFDFGYSIAGCNDGGWLCYGMSSSNDGDVHGNHGGDYDAWLIKIGGLASAIPNLSPEVKLQISPNPADAFTMIKSTVNHAPFSIYNSEGKLVQSGLLQAGNNLIETDQLSSGLYIIRSNNNQFLPLRCMIVHLEK